MSPPSAPPNPRRVGGHLVAESLAALGAPVAFGVPGQHALGIFDGLAGGRPRFVGLRTEVGASFAAHGYATASGEPAPLLVSTGPGALMALAGLQEADTTGTPVVCICSEIPREGLGRNQGYVHELRDQIAHFEPVVRSAVHVHAAEAIPDALAQAWRTAQTAPSGPVFVQIPVDVLTGPTDAPPVVALDGSPDPRPPRADAVRHAARLLDAADRPLVLAGGGVLRSGAWEALRALAGHLDAPVVLTYGGKGVLAPGDPLFVGSACEDASVQRVIAEADVVLAVGTSLSEETTNHAAMRLGGSLIQIEPDITKVATRHRAHPIVADAHLALDALRAAAAQRAPGSGADRAAAARDALAERWEREGRADERGLLRAVEAALPPGAVSSWDMTIMAYWATMDLAVATPRSFLYPQGSGTLGYGLPAALGAAIARPDAPVLAVAGDGGIMYGLAEVAAARQHDLDVRLLVIDDGGYGILREYQREAFGRTFATDLVRPDFLTALDGLGLPTRRTDIDGLPDALGQLFATAGPAALVLDFSPTMFEASA